MSSTELNMESQDDCKRLRNIGSISSTPVRLEIQHGHVVISNGILQLTLSNPEGIVTGILDNLLFSEKRSNSGWYWDIHWNFPNTKGGNYEIIISTSFKVIMETEEQVEVSFTRPWDPSRHGKDIAPINIDKRFILLRGCPGFYSYAIYEHKDTAEWPAFGLGETRMVFKLNMDKFCYMAVADDRRRRMPLPEDREPPRGESLAYKEAVLLVNPVEAEFKGEVDDQYQYSCDNKDLGVHGWVADEKPEVDDQYQYSCDNKDLGVHGWVADEKPEVGFWLITPSNEFRSGGPVKQELSSHVGPTMLAMFVSSHYAGADLTPYFEQGEEWKKVYGPVFFYLNSVVDGKDVPLALWEDAKRQLIVESKSWPYSFPASTDFPKSYERGNVRGRLLVRDRIVDEKLISANGAYVGLAPPGDFGSWQRECKGYQFWTKADEGGHFSINNIRTGNYNLYAWVPGFIGDYRNDVLIAIASGSDINVGNLVYEPPRDGPTIWEIGIPDRSAAEFYIPEPNPKYFNKFLDISGCKFRQYGLWERYQELYPDGDLIFTIGESNYKTDWFFAQVTRKQNGMIYEGTTWQIKFKLENLKSTGTYILRIALAGASQAKVQVNVNNLSTTHPLFSSNKIGNDNMIARHGIHGLYWLFNIDIPGSILLEGENTIYLRQPKGDGPFVESCTTTFG